VTRKSPPRLRVEIGDRLNAVLPRDRRVTDAFFTPFVLQ